MRVLMSGGGTAGHIYPALSVAGTLLEGGLDSVIFVGTPDGTEARLVPEAGVPFYALPARGYDRSRPLTLITSSATILTSTFKARALMRNDRPDVVVGFGGYVSLPVGLAAVLSRIPLVLHEQNSVPGLANRVLSRWANRVGVTYAESSRRLRHPERAEVTGNPVRTSVLRADRDAARKDLGVKGDDVLLVVFGGSRGARHINECMIANAPAIMREPGVRVLHIAGRSEAPQTQASIEASAVDQSRYQVVDYVDDMGSVIAAADLLVARAGATSIAEITAIGRAAIYVPYPYATDDHQTLNARTLLEAGAGRLVADPDLDTPQFVDAVIDLLRAQDVRATMAAASKGLGRPQAAESLVEMIREAAGSQS